jgi:hypothetical protein
VTTKIELRFGAACLLFSALQKFVDLIEIKLLLIAIIVLTFHNASISSKDSTVPLTFQPIFTSPCPINSLNTSLPIKPCLVLASLALFEILTRLVVTVLGTEACANVETGGTPAVAGLAVRVRTNTGATAFEAATSVGGAFDDSDISASGSFCGGEPAAHGSCVQGGGGSCRPANLAQHTAGRALAETHNQRQFAAATTAKHRREYNNH